MIFFGCTISYNTAYKLGCEFLPVKNQIIHLRQHRTMIGDRCAVDFSLDCINPTTGTSVTIAQSVGTDAGAQSDCLNARNTDVFQEGFVQVMTLRTLRVLGKSASRCAPKPSGGHCAVLS